MWDVEEELRETQRLARIGSWSWDPTTDTMKGSEELLRIFGFDGATQTMPNFKDQRERCYSAKDWESIDKAMVKTLEIGDDFELVVNLLREDAPIWVIIRGARVLDDNDSVLGLRGTVQDITEGRSRDSNAHRIVEREQATQETLREALARAEEGNRMLTALMEYVPAGITIADAPDVKIRMNSRVGTEITGKPEDHLEVAYGELTESWDLYRADGETLPTDDEIPLTRAARQGETVRNEVWVLGDKEGRRIPLLCNAGPIRDGEGRITGAVVTYSDITERRQAEEALREADRRKDEFLAVLSHELRNPLAPIRTGIEILKIAYDSPSARTIVPVLDRQVEHMTRLLDDLLDVSRITRGKVELIRERVDLSEVIRVALETSSPLIESMNHELILKLPDDPIMLDADPVRLSQVFSNLLNNAAKYMKSGGHIEVGARVEEDNVLVSIKDEGVGMSSDSLATIFDMFSQVGTSLARSQGGLGIGLSLVQGLVALHGGSVEAHSAGLGQGSEFLVRLPIAPITKN